jgi:hypothetical protein
MRGKKSETPDRCREQGLSLAISKCDDLESVGQRHNARRM